MSQEASRREYVARVNRVIDHIEQNLSEPLPLAHLAGIACFSPYHFHRIFKALAGETLTAFVQRLRVERAASTLLLDPERPITHGALDCGFASSASFARAFCATFGMSATDWRQADEQTRMAKRKIGQTFRKESKAAAGPSGYLMSKTFSHKDEDMTLETEIKVEHLPAVNVAYHGHLRAGEAALASPGNASPTRRCVAHGPCVIRRESARTSPDAATRQAHPSTGAARRRPNRPGGALGPLGSDGAQFALTEPCSTFGII